MLRCEVEAATGNRLKAFEIAEGLTARGMPATIAVRALLVAARVDLYMGRLSDGQSKYQRAQVLATESGDVHLPSVALAAYVSGLLHFVSLEAGSVHISALKRAALRSGQPANLFALRLLLAEVELKAGRRHRALAELSLAALHLDTAPSIVREAQLEFIRGVITASLGDVASAYEHTLRAAQLASTAGAATIAEPARNNVAHLQFLLGHHDLARSSLERLLEATPNSIDVQLTRRSTQLQVFVAVGDMAAASEVDDLFAPAVSPKTTIHGYWYNLARTYYLLRSGKTREATLLAKTCLESLDATSDRNLLERIRIAGADALAQAADRRQAMDLLSTVALGPLRHGTELLAAAARVQGRLVDGRAMRVEHFHRAARVFGHFGHITARGEALYEIAKLAALEAAPQSADSTIPHITSFYGAPSRVFGRIDSSPLLGPAAAAVSSSIGGLAAMVDLTSSPILSGYELLSLASMSGAAAGAALVARQNGRREALAWTGSDAVDPTLLRPSDELVTIELGQEREAAHEVVVRPANQGGARVSLLALQRVVASAQTLHRSLLAESERSALWPDPLPEQQLGFVCASESMLELLRTTRRVAASNIMVLITGETGTGKELLAKAVHQCSPRHGASFLPFNCTAVAKDMLDSQLFGYRKGAFTGAQDAFPGIIRGAAGGTLFLDEIGEIGVDVQPKLLRFLESGEVHPLGETSPVTVDVRVVAATNANLERLVAEGRFREDLYYRLNVVPLHIPPLRERREEIPLLLDHFLERGLKEAGKSGIRFAESTSEYLLLYAWPGNVRELANEVRRMVALAEPGAVLMPEHLSPTIAASRRTVPPTERPIESTEFVVRRDQPLSAAVEHVERTMIQDALRASANVELAAKRLGLSRKGLYLKRQRLHIDE